MYLERTQEYKCELGHIYQQLYADGQLVETNEPREPWGGGEFLKPYSGVTPPPNYPTFHSSSKAVFIALKGWGYGLSSHLSDHGLFSFLTTSTYHPLRGITMDNAASNLAAAAPGAKVNTLYQNEMIRDLREGNIDANNVGWYMSANMGNFLNANMIENQYRYQKDFYERTVALVHDVSRSSQGSLSLHAFRLSTAFTSAYKEKNFI
jgi:hypothetical protein